MMRRKASNLNLENFVNTEKPVKYIAMRKVIAASEKSRLIDIISLMHTRKVRKVPIVDNSCNLKGIVTDIDLLDVLGGGEKHEIFRENGNDMGICVEKFMTKDVKTINQDTSIRKSFEILKTERIGALPITDSGRAVSMITAWDFVKLIGSPTGVKVREVMIERPFIARNGYAVGDIAKIMCRVGLNWLPVMENNIPVGNITPWDVISHIHESGIYDKLASDHTSVDKIMKKEIIEIHPDSDLSQAARIMKNLHIEGLPVVDDEELVGIVTGNEVIGSLV